MTNKLPIEHGDTGAIAKEKIETSFAELLENVQKFKPTIVDKVWYIGGISTGVPAEGKDIELGADQNYIKYRLSGGEWINLVSLSQLKGPKGDQGKDGPKGDDGNDGYGISSMQSQKVGDDTVVKVWYTDGSFNEFTIFGGGVSAGGQKVEDMYVRNDDKNVITKLVFEDGTEREFSVPKTNYGIGGGGGTASGNPVLSMFATNDNTNVYIHLRFVGDPGNPVAYTLPKSDLGLGGGGGGGGGSLVNENGGTTIKVWAGDIMPANMNSDTLYFIKNKGVYFGNKGMRPFPTPVNYPTPGTIQDDVLEFGVWVNEGTSNPTFKISMRGPGPDYALRIAINDGSYTNYVGQRGQDIELSLPSGEFHNIYVRPQLLQAGRARSIASDGYSKWGGNNNGFYLKYLPGYAFMEREEEVGNGFMYRLFYGVNSLRRFPSIINLPQGITTVGNDFMRDTFSGCSGLQTLPSGFNLPQGITTVGNDFMRETFSGCSGLQTLPSGFNLPQGITTVGNDFMRETFLDCTGLQTLPSGFNLPQGITTVGNDFMRDTFSGCSGLQTLPVSFDFPQNIESAGRNFCYSIFYNTYLDKGEQHPKLHIPKIPIVGKSFFFNSWINGTPGGTEGVRRHDGYNGDT